MPAFDAAVSDMIEAMRRQQMDGKDEAHLDQEETLARETNVKEETMPLIKKQTDAEYWKIRAARHQRETMATAKIQNFDKGKKAENNAWILATNKKDNRRMWRYKESWILDFLNLSRYLPCFRMIPLQ